MKFLKVLSVVFVFGVVLTSCGDDGTSPDITIKSPNDGAAVNFDTEFVVDVDVTDDIGVTSITIEVTDIPALTLTETQFTDPTNVGFEYRATIPTGSVDAGEYEVVVTALDADGNSDEEKVKINVQ